MKAMKPCLASLLILAASVSQANAENQDLLANLHDAYVHPQCLAPLLAYERETVPDQVVCDPALEQQLIEVYHWEGQEGRKTSYSADYPKEPDDDWYAGAISYSVARRWISQDGVDVSLLSVTNNTGGTGHFSSLWLLKKQVGGAVIEPLLELRGGDRCNDGLLRVIEYDEGGVTYASAATPFRLLNPLDEHDWRFAKLLEALAKMKGAEAPDQTLPEPFMGWQPYDDVANSATSCSGELINRYYFETDKIDVIGVSIDREEFLSEGQGIMQPCINEWLKESEIGKYALRAPWVALDEWMASLRGLGRYCRDAP